MSGFSLGKGETIRLGGQLRARSGRWGKMGEGIKQKREKKGENKKKPGIQRVLHLSYDRTGSKREYPTQCRSRNRDHRVRHRRPRLDDVSTATATAGRNHSLVPTVVPRTRLSVTRFERCRYRDK